MLFSIVTVTRNNLAGLKRTQESVAVQCCRDYEWVVVDGASDDGTAEFLEMTEAKWASEPDRGIYDAMNKGIDRAKGDYVIFMNAGDAFANSHVLEKIAEALEGAPDFIYGDALEDGNYKAARSHEKIVLGMFTHHQAMLYRRAAIGDLRYDPAYRIAADYKFTAQFLQQAKNVLYCPFALCRFESGGVSQQNARHGRREQFRVRRQENLAGFVKSGLIYAAQEALWLFRSVCPALYWRLRRR